MRADEILKKRRDRALAIILSVKEREVDALLSQEAGGPQASRMLRKVILDQFNDFCELALDVTASGEAANFEFNPEVWMRKINEKINDIHGALTNGSR